MRTAGLLLCCALLAPGQDLPTVEPGDALMQEYRVAWELYQQRKSVEAIARLQELIGREKQFYRGYYTLVQAWSQLHQLDEAQRYFTRLSTDPASRSGAEYALANVAMLQRKPAEGLQHARRCLQSDPQAWPCALDAMKGALDTRSDLADLKREFHRMEGPQARYIHLLRAKLTYEQRRWADAISEARAGMEEARAARAFELEIYLLEVTANASAGAGNVSATLALRKEIAHAAAAYGDDEKCLTAWLAAGLEHNDQHETGHKYLDAALAEIRRRNLLQLQVRGDWFLATFDTKHQHAQSAIDAYERIRSEYRAARDATYAANISVELARIQAGMGDSEKALGSYREALEEPGLADRAVMGLALRGMGSVYASTGDYLKALDYNRRAIREFDTARKLDSAGATWGNVGALYAEFGAFEQAIVYFRRALQSAIRYNDAGGQQENLTNIADMHLRAGQVRESLAPLRQSLKLTSVVRYPAMTSAGQRLMGLAQERMGNPRAALEWYGRAIETARQATLAVQEGLAREAMGETQLRLGELVQAEESFREGLSIAERAKSPALALASRRGMASLLRRRQQPMEALAFLSGAG